MKKKLYIMVASVLALGYSCDLDREPETNFTGESFWTSEKDIMNASTKLYSDLAGWNYMSNPSDKNKEDGTEYMHDPRADLVIPTTPDPISAGSRTAPATSINNWTDLYARIDIANNIIRNSPKVEVNVNKDIVNRWTAEAHFFRAYYYFILVKLYGDVPLVLKAFDGPTDPNLYMGRAPRADVLKAIYEDLEFAEKWLPNMNAKDLPWGRVSKSAALALQVRVGLYEGTFGKYHNLNNDYVGHLTKSIEASERIFKLGYHKLHPSFDELFKNSSGVQSVANKEAIFVKRYSIEKPHTHTRRMENSFCLSRSAIDQFLYIDGLPMDKSTLRVFPEPSYDTPLMDRDPRLLLTTYRIGEIGHKNSPYVPYEAPNRGYPIKKGFTIEEWSTNGKETINSMLIRYAEVLVSFAEALYERDGKISDTDLNRTINELRSRVEFDAKLTNEFVANNGLNMRDEIRRERTVELMDEGFRYDDIIRWKIAEQVLNKPVIGAKYVQSEVGGNVEDYKGRLTDENGMIGSEFGYAEPNSYVIEVGGTRRFNPERDYYYPIPINEMTLSKGNVVQNEKW